jgi:large subunit ribosomal protein L29
MKKNNNSLQELTVQELQARVAELKQEIFNFRLQQQSGQLERPHLLRTLRREIARIETVITEKSVATA